MPTWPPLSDISESNARDIVVNTLEVGLLILLDKKTGYVKRLNADWSERSVQYCFNDGRLCWTAGLTVGGPIGEKEVSVVKLHTHGYAYYANFYDPVPADGLTQEYLTELVVNSKGKILI